MGVEKFSKTAWIKSLEGQARLNAVEWIASLPHIDGTQKCVMFAIASTINASYETDASLRDICSRAGLSVRAAQNAIYGNVTTKKDGKEFVRKSIEELIPGALTITHRKIGKRQNLSNLYRLGVPRCVAAYVHVSFDQDNGLSESSACAESAVAPPEESAHNAAESAVAPSEESAQNANDIGNLRGAESAHSPEDSAGKGQSYPNQVTNSLDSGPTEKLAYKGEDDAQYPEPHFLEKLVHAWNQCLVPLGASRQSSIDPMMRKKFMETYRLNTVDLSHHFANKKKIESLSDWIDFFRHIAASDYLMGRTKMKNGLYFTITFKFMLGVDDGGYPRSYLIRDGQYHKATTPIPDNAWAKPDFRDFEPTMLWGAVRNPKS